MVVGMWVTVVETEWLGRWFSGLDENGEYVGGWLSEWDWVSETEWVSEWVGE